MTIDELEDLECFVEDLEYSISINLYGTETKPDQGEALKVLNEQSQSLFENERNKENNDNENSGSSDNNNGSARERHPATSFTPERANRILLEDHSQDPLDFTGRFFVDHPRPKQSKYTLAEISLTSATLFFFFFGKPIVLLKSPLFVKY